MNKSMRIKWLCFLISGVTALLSACGPSLPPEVEAAYETLPDKIDFNYHIKPILSDRCFKCHGPDANKRMANLRLDESDHAFVQTQGNASDASQVLEPGSLNNSELFLRLISDDPERIMPPPSENLTLTSREIAMIAKWIEQGAEYKPHWSFVAPEKPKIPPVEKSEWPRQPLDYFILSKMEEHGLEPAERADKATLLRRIYLDLTGLPPSAQEVDAFLADPDPNAYEKAVDRLLESPHYGERMAYKWMDVARYADSHGYQDDGLRNTWPWRDWVIRKFNENQPFDQFLVEQLAGDLLPNPTKDQILATCFNRNHPQTQEGGVIDEEYRVEYVADRTNTFGKALLGLTMECARCHDHKYDPISQKDYFSLYAFFDNNHDTGIVPYNGEASPTVLLPDDAEQKTWDSLKNAQKPLLNALVSDQYKQELQTWLSQKDRLIEPEYGLVADFSFEKLVSFDLNQTYFLGDRNEKKPKPRMADGFINRAKNRVDATYRGDPDRSPELVEGYRGKGLLFKGDAGVRFNRDLDFDRYQPFSVSLWVKLLKEGEEGPIFNKTNGDFEGYRGWLCKLNEDGTLSLQLNHVWPANSIDYQTVNKLPVNEWTHLALTYDGSSKANGLRFFINGKEPELILHADNLQKSILHGLDGSNWSNLPFMLGMELRKTIQNMVMDELKVYNRELSIAEITHLHEGVQPDPTQDQWLEYYLLSGQNPEYNRTLSNLTGLREAENDLTTNMLEVMVMKERQIPRTTYILDRGAYDAPTTEVEPSTPEVLPRFPEDLPQNRLGLARWLVDPQHPLTSRITVNRFWAMLFGRGLVVTEEDFGNQGNLPLHPELLDYLAVSFVEEQWNVKQFLKTVLMSSTYQMSSNPGPAAVKSDPANEYYSHFPSYRLSAEMIRDQALAASGLLVKEIGGPSVYPYQPKGIWKALATRNVTEYKQGTGDDLYRRSLYTIWKRSSPPPSMMNFDAPDRYYCVVRRQKTSTPLQSLVLMNDPQFIEAANFVAQCAINKHQDNRPEKVQFIVKQLLGRPATPGEMEIMMQMYAEEYRGFEQDEERAQHLLEMGESEIDGTLDPADVATCGLIASTVMNSDAFVMKR